MLVLKIIIWVFLFIIFYAYLGYGILLFFMISLKRILVKKEPAQKKEYEPEVTLFVAAYNEKDFVDEKIKNSILLD